MGSSSSAEAPSGALRALLITNNVCGIYDDLERRLPLWLERLSALIDRQQSDFVVVHMQEVGGSNWKKGGLELVKPHADAIAKHFPQFWVSGLLCDTEASSLFTALGACFLVRRSAMARVEMWVQQDGTAASGAFCRLSELPSPLVDVPRADPKYCYHTQFPSHLFGDGKISRKGFLLTSWRLDGSAVDVMNVHNIHDASNWVALERTPSIYAERRRNCLAHALEQRAVLLRARAGANAVGAPLFVFGDFNFRLSLPAVVQQICGAAAVENAHKLRRDALAAQTAGDASAAAEDVAVDLSKSGEGSLAGEASGVGQAAIHLAPKFFRLARPVEVIEQLEAFRAFDGELSGFASFANSAPADGVTALYERQPTFPPTYSYDDATNDRLTLRRGTTRADAGGSFGDIVAAHGGAGGAGGEAAAAPPLQPDVSDGDVTMAEASAGASSDAVPSWHGAAVKMASHFSVRRCPAWCDRVLMNDAARSLVDAAAAPVYDSELQQPVITDHNAVFLAFDLPKI